MTDCPHEHESDTGLQMEKSNGRRLFKARPVLDTGGIQLIPETPQTGA